MNVTKRQHYVPRWYMRQWNKNESLYFLNVGNDSIHPCKASDKNHCNSDYLYEFCPNIKNCDCKSKCLLINIFENSYDKSASVYQNIIENLSARWRLNCGCDTVAILDSEKVMLFWLILSFVYRNPFYVGSDMVSDFVSVVSDDMPLDSLLGCLQLLCPFMDLGSVRRFIGLVSCSVYDSNIIDRKLHNMLNSGRNRFTDDFECDVLFSESGSFVFSNAVVRFEYDCFDNVNFIMIPLTPYYTVVFFRELEIFQCRKNRCFSINEDSVYDFNLSYCKHYYENPSDLFVYSGSKDVLVRMKELKGKKK